MKEHEIHSEPHAITQPIPMPVFRQPRAGDSVLFHFDFRGGIRSRPGVITQATLGKAFVNIMVFYDGANDGRSGHDIVGHHIDVRQLPDGVGAIANTWSYRPEQFHAEAVVGIVPGLPRP